MPTYTYTRDIPFEDNNPSDDQPIMKTNANSIDDIIDVDHYSFETSNQDGWHRQITFPAQNTAGAQVDPASTLYTDADASSASTNSNLWYRNADGIFPTSAIRSCGVFTTVGTAAPVAVTVDNGFNATVQKTGSTTYEVTLTANSVTGDNVILFVSRRGSTQTFPATFSNPVVTITTSGSAGQAISFLVIQI